MIENSKKYFYMNLLVFSCDPATEKLVRLLEAKSKSGVDVRLIINTAFSYMSMSCLKRLKLAGVKIVKTKTHSSYFLNDRQELMIGSQVVAKMFFYSDGFNSLDRDMMIYAKGAVTSDAFRDFISIWSESGDDEYASDKFKDLNQYRELLKIKSAIKSERACRFVAERPKQGVADIQNLWKELININQRELYFSGVMVDIGNSEIGSLLKAKSNSGMEVHYLGNSYKSGNGELTMVLHEWIDKLKKGSFSVLVPVLAKITAWDMARVAYNNQKLYDQLKANSSINVWGYFNFIHYKVWLFDEPGFFIGSANLDVKKFGKINDAGIFCQDKTVHNELKQYLLRDKMNSMLYLPHAEAKK